MSRPSSPAQTVQQVLATDLDGTLIPLEGNRQNLVDLKTLAHAIQDNGTTLVFVTGRHFESVSIAIDELELPLPDWIICDVGTSIFKHTDSREFALVNAFQQHLAQIIAALPIHTLRERLERVEGLRPQEENKQGLFKLSFYADSARLKSLVEQVQAELRDVDAPYSVINSVDPFNGDGLIDLVPADVSKAYALKWWSEYTRLNADGIVFSGDSGNDLAALTAGYRAVVVANADDTVVQQARIAHQSAGWSDRLFIARGKATSGVLEGCRRFFDWA
ncbi:MAG: HAD-IIB family hydrolase [Cyanobacteria bacterium P01_F01_bin.42]